MIILLTSVFYLVCMLNPIIFILVIFLLRMRYCILMKLLLCIYIWANWVMDVCCGNTLIFHHNAGNIWNPAQTGFFTMYLFSLQALHKTLKHWNSVVILWFYSNCTNHLNACSSSIMCVTFFFNLRHCRLPFEISRYSGLQLNWHKWEKLLSSE